MVKEKRNIAQEIKDGLVETLDFVKGTPTKGRVTYFYDGDPISPREIREEILGITRETFCTYFNLPVNSQRNWELGLRRPPQHTLAYYKLIKEAPAVIYKILHNAAMPPTH